jgi:hypothetical protein
MVIEDLGPPYGVAVGAGDGEAVGLGPSLGVGV